LKKKIKSILLLLLLDGNNGTERLIKINTNNTLTTEKSKIKINGFPLVAPSPT
jgi:hypothetical protein